MVRKFAVLVALVVALVPATAFAGEVTDVVYDGPQQKVAGFTSASSTNPPKTAAAETLPFTGVDLGLVVIAGVGLVLMGASLRRIARGSDR